MSCAFVGMYPFLFFSYIHIRLLFVFLKKQKGRRVSLHFNYNGPFGVSFLHVSFTTILSWPILQLFSYPKTILIALLLPEKKSHLAEGTKSLLHRNSCMPSTAPWTNSSNSAEVTLLILLCLPACILHRLKWWLHLLTPLTNQDFTLMPSSNISEWISHLRSAMLK